MKKKLIRFLVAGSIGILTGKPLPIYAIEGSRLDINIKANSSNVTDKIELNATFDSASDSPSRITDPQHILYSTYNKVKDILSQYGTVTPGIETGATRTSLRVLVDRMKDQVSLATEAEKRPKLLDQALALHAAFEPYWDDYNQLSAEKFLAKYKTGLYATLQWASSEDVSRFVLCTVLDYQAHVKNAITLPIFLKMKMDRECKAFNADIEHLEKATLLVDKVIRKLPLGDSIGDFPDYWSPTKFSDQFGICNSLQDLDALFDAGWMTTGQGDITVRRNECRNSLNKNVLSKIDEAMTLGMNSSVLKKNITPYYRKIVENLLNDGGEHYLIEAKDIEKEVAQKVGAIFNFKQGFTVNKLDSSFFNTNSFLKAIEKKVDDPMSLITVLLSCPESAESKLRQEMSQYSEEDQKAYIQGLLKTIGRLCQPEDYISSCIFNRVMRLNTQQSRVTLRSGIEAVTVWSGFVFHHAHDTKEEP